MTVLIHTIPGDTHAAAIQVALSLKNKKSRTWYVADFPSHQIISAHLCPTDPINYFIKDDVNEESIFSEKFDTVWHRRIGSLQPVPDAVHSFDKRFVASELKTYLATTIPLIGRDAFWVNGVAESHYAENKLIQLEMAKKVGLKIPETLATNSLDDIKSFLRQTPDRKVIYKPFQARSWSFSGGRELIPYTKIVTESDLPDEPLIRACPGIYQPYVEKKTELRVTIMGNYVTAASVDALDREDWRASSETTGLTVRNYMLPPDIEAKCLSLMKELKLVFGSLDFIVTPQDEFIFLEVNEMGQFLWVEYHDPSARLLAAFTDFLIERDPEFRWKAPENAIRHADICKSEEYKKILRESNQHISQPIIQLDENKK